MPASARLRRLCTIPALVLAVLLASFTLGPVSSASAGTSSRVVKATRIAVAQIGDPYRYGAAGPRAFDCSGLIYYSFRRAGVRNVPRTSSAQARRAHHISRKKLRRGDLMFFTSRGRVYHAAIFLRWSHGRALMLHSPRPGQRVRRERAWTNSWFAATLRG